jgi:hypothetical protein
MVKALAKPTMAASTPAEIGCAMEPVEEAATAMEFPIRPGGLSKLAARRIGVAAEMAKSGAKSGNLFPVAASNVSIQRGMA